MRHVHWLSIYGDIDRIAQRRLVKPVRGEVNVRVLQFVTQVVNDSGTRLALFSIQNGVED